MIHLKKEKKKETNPCNQRFLHGLVPYHLRVYLQLDPNRIFVRDRDRLVKCSQACSLGRRSLACEDAPDRIISNQDRRIEQEIRV
jgi:hypothetical protein